MSKKRWVLWVFSNFVGFYYSFFAILVFYYNVLLLIILFNHSENDLKIIITKYFKQYNNISVKYFKMTHFNGFFNKYYWHN